MDYTLRYPRPTRLGLLDDEDEAELQRRQQEIGALEPTYAMRPDASMPPARPTLSALLPQSDPSLDSRWREAENSALDQSGYGGEQSYGIGEGLRDFAPMAIGGALDVLLNKGRGLGALTGGGMQALSMERARRQKGEQDAANYALRVKTQRDAGGDRAIQAQHAMLRGEGMDLERERLDIERQKLGAKDPESAARANYLESQAYQNWTKDPNALDPDTVARLQQQRELHDQDLADRKEARADSAAYRSELAAGRQEAAATRAQAQQERADTRDTNTFLDKTKEARDQARSIQSVEPIVENPKYAKDKPGVGWFDSTAPSWMSHPFDPQARADSDTVKQQTAEAYAYFRHKLTGAAFGKLEDADYKAMKGLSGTEAEWSNAMKHWKASVQKDLRSRATAAPEVSRRALEAEGLGQWTYGDEAPPPAADATGYGPDPDHPSNLGVTAPPGVRNTPDFPGGATRYRAGSGRAQAAGRQPMPGGSVNQPDMVLLVDPEGEEGEVSAADAEELIRRHGYRRVR